MFFGCVFKVLLKFLITVVQKFVPLAQTKSSSIKQLMQWAESGNVALASGPN